MKTLFPSSPSSSRWRTLTAFVIFPLAMVTTLIAAGSYGSVRDGIESRWRQSTHAAAVSARIRLIGVAETLTAAGQAAQDADGDEAQCDAALRRAIPSGDGVEAVSVVSGDGRVCMDVTTPELTAVMPSVGRDLAARAKIALAPGLSLTAGTAQAGGRAVLAVQARTSNATSSATALLDAAAFARAIDLAPGPGEIDALMSRGAVLTASGAPSSDITWLPAAGAAVGAEVGVTAARAQTGATFAYATAPVLGPDLYILKRFSQSDLVAAQIRFLALALAPPFLAALCFALAGASQSELLGGVRAIMAAMLTRRADNAVVLAPEDERMPAELREFAAGYNEMAREAASHARSLRTSLAENEFLLRELNHRVKSSLQIIQSYLSLTRRFDRGSGRQTSSAAIEARVQVLSIAYRKGFSEGRMRDVRIRQFAEEIVANLPHLFEWPALALELKANVVAALVIDRAIPLGLAMVESLIAGMAADGAHTVTVSIDQMEDFGVEIHIRTDGELRAGEPNTKLLAGLALQLAASADDPVESGTILHWRFQGRPPPTLSTRSDLPRPHPLPI